MPRADLAALLAAVCLLSNVLCDAAASPPSAAASRKTSSRKSPSPGPKPLPAAGAVMVGDPAHPEALAQAVQEAYDGGARNIVIRRGVYLMPDSGHTSLTLKGWKDATLSASGVTLILTDLTWAHDGIDLADCTHVTVSGMLLSQNKITSYQGRVVAIGKDDAGKPTCDWRPDAGYPVPSATDKAFMGGNFNVVDAHTRLLKTGNGDFYNAAFEALPDNVFRVHAGGNFGVGDWLVGRYGNAPFKIFLENCRDCTIKDVTMMRNGFAPLREDGGGGNHYLRCIWALGPAPAGAVENPVVTNAADGMHMTNSDPGPDIENCKFQGVFLDDCIAIHGGFQTVKSVSGATLTLDGGAGNVRAGMPVRISDQKGFFAEAQVTAVKDNGDKTTTVTLDKDYHVPPSAKLSNPRADGAGYKIIGCHLGSTRSRGILAKADNGLIKNNVLEGCGMSAVSLGPEYSWGEADYVQNVTVEDNVIRNNGGATYGGAAILVHGDGAIGNKNIIVRRNQMSANSQGDMDVQWVDGFIVSGNTMTAPMHWPAGVQPTSPIRLANCADVLLRGNLVQNAASYHPDLVAVGPAVSNLQYNDLSGIRAVDTKAQRMPLSSAVPASGPWPKS